ncbi:MAG: BON domain-containing protein [Ignavibacteriaceae bacterium]
MSGLSFALTSNENLANKVENVINNHYNGNFDVTVDNNHFVTITGQVNTYFDKLKLFQIVSKIKGVRDIADNVTINAPILPDKIIQANIVNELDMVSSILEPNRISVSVDNGEVILGGTVSFYREKLMAETVTSWEKGVKGISNNIKVLSPAKAVSDANLKIILQDILNDQFPVEKNVSFTVSKGIVDINGTVDILYAKRRIQDEFSSIIGIKKVINNLKVEPYTS